MKRKSRKPGIQLPIIPDHLIVEQILPRLPVKTLIRFKSVCKFWFSTISSLEFQKNHLKFSSTCNNRSLIIQDENRFTNGNSYGDLLSLDECLNVKEFVKLDNKYNTMNLPTPPHYSTVVGSCDGLVCLYNSRLYNTCFFLWNPATSQCHNTFHPDFDCDHIDDNAGHGFGYVSSMDDYRIGCLLLCDEELVHVCIYSLKARKWMTPKTINTSDAADYIPLLGDKFGYVINDIMYWPPAFSHIIALNLVDGELKRIPLMSFGADYYEAHVFQIKGCLSLCMLKDGNDNKVLVYDVWMLKQLDDLNSWEKIISLRDEHPSLFIHIFETGECLRGPGSNKLMLHGPRPVAPEQYDEGAVIWQGPEEGTFFGNVVGVGWGYVESFISPFGTPEHEDDNETQH